MIATAAANDTAEIYIYDEIGASLFGGISAAMVSDELVKLKSVSRITVHINSPGGDAFEGVAIYNRLKDHRAKIHVEVDGVAASAASVIAMAGDTISMADNAMMMIHEARCIVQGRASDLTARVELLKKLNQQIVNTYCARTGNSAADVARWMDAETWMDAQEAIDMGFATDVIEAKGPAAYASAAMDEKQREWAMYRAEIEQMRIGV